MLVLRLSVALGLLSSTTLARHLVQRQDGCRAGVITVNGQQFTVQCDADRAGNNLGDASQTTSSGCAQLCAKDTQCVTAQYFNGFCYKKQSQNQVSVVKGVTTYDKGNGCTDNLKVSGCNVKCSTDSPGNNIDAGTYVGSYAACANLCANNSQCATAQYKTTNGFCYQKSRINGNGFSPADDTVSLVCPDNGYVDPAKSKTTSASTTSSITSTKSTTASTTKSKTTTCSTTASTTPTTTAPTTTPTTTSTTTTSTAGPAPTCSSGTSVGQPCQPRKQQMPDVPAAVCGTTCALFSNFGQGCTSTSTDDGSCTLNIECCTQIDLS